MQLIDRNTEGRSYLLYAMLGAPLLATACILLTTIEYGSYSAKWPLL